MQGDQKMKQGEARRILAKEFGNVMYYNTEWHDASPLKTYIKTKRGHVKTPVCRRIMRGGLSYYRISNGTIHYLPPELSDRYGVVREFFYDRLGVPETEDLDDEAYVDLTRKEIIEKWNEYIDWLGYTADTRKAEFTLDNEFSIEDDCGWKEYGEDGPQTVTKAEYDHVWEKVRKRPGFFPNREYMQSLLARNQHIII